MKTHEPTEREAERTVLAAGLMVALLAIGGAIALSVGRSSGDHALHAQIEAFTVFFALNVFALASLQYGLGRQRLYLPLAIGLLAVGLFGLVHPVLEPGAGGLHGPRDQSAADILWWLGRVAFAASLIAAARRLTTAGPDDNPLRRLVNGLLGAICAVAVAITLVILVPGPWRSLGTPAAGLLPLALLASAAWTMRRNAQPIDSGLRAFGFLSASFAVLGETVLFFQAAPFDASFVAAHILYAGSLMVILIGLYVDYARLVGQERGRRHSLEDAQHQLEGIFEDLTDGVVLTDEHGVIRKMNGAARAILGRDMVGAAPPAFTGTAGVTTPDGRPLAPEDHPIARVLATHQAVSDVEVVITRPNGDRRTIVAGAVVVRDDVGVVVGCVAAFHDVTEIRSAEQRFRAVIESAPDAVLVLDDEWNILLANQRAERLWGLPRSLLVGRGVDGLVPERLRADFVKARPATIVAPSEHSRPLETRIARSDGTERSVEIRVAATQESGGRRLVAHFRDAADRERVRRLRDARVAIADAAAQPGTIPEFLQRVAEAIPLATHFDACAIYLRDPERGRLTIQAATGVSQEAFHGADSYPLNPTWPAGAVRAWFGKQADVEAPEAEPNLFHEAGAAPREYRSVVSARIGAGPETLGVLQVAAVAGRHPAAEDAQLLEDLGEALGASLLQRQLVEQLEKSSRELAAANEELDSFIYTASHDLGEPLRSITNFSHFLIADYNDRLDAEGRDYLERVNNGAARMKHLLDDLLRLSRVGRLNSQRGRVDLSDVVREVRESLDAMIHERKARLESPPTLPAVLADRTSVVEIVANLVSNALKFNDSPNPRVDVEATAREHVVELRVRDNGIGIATEHLDRIFGLFTRLHPRKAYPGTGAGLAIVKKIVEQAGGRVWVESTPGKGSTFYVTLPAWEPDQATPLEIPEARTPTA